MPLLVRRAAFPARPDAPCQLVGQCHGSFVVPYPLFELDSPLLQAVGGGAAFAWRLADTNAERAP